MCHDTNLDDARSVAKVALYQTRESLPLVPRAFGARIAIEHEP